MFRPISSNICQPTELLCTTIPSAILPTRSIYVDHYLSQMSLEECYPYQGYTNNQSHFYDIQQFENSPYNSMASHDATSPHNMFQPINNKQKSDDDYLFRSTVRLALGFVLLYIFKFMFIVFITSYLTLLQYSITFLSFQRFFHGDFR